jgi:hypothetical protein
LPRRRLALVGWHFNFGSRSERGGGLFASIMAGIVGYHAAPAGGLPFPNGLRRQQPHWPVGFELAGLFMACASLIGMYLSADRRLRRPAGDDVVEGFAVRGAARLCKGGAT